MLSERDVSAAIGGTAYSTSGDKIGTVEHFFADDRTGAPSWVAVTTGLFGTRHSIVPATDATFADGGLRLPVTTEAVKSAPHLEGDHLGPDEEARLRRHYGLEQAAGTAWTPTSEGLRPPGAADDDDPVVSAAPHPAPPPAPPTVAFPPPAPPVVPPVPAPGPVPGRPPSPVPPPPAAYHSQPADVPPDAVGPTDTGAMTRSEEQLRVGTERVAAKRVRLVKYIVTEEVQITVPIRREEFRVEEVPLDGVDEGPGESLMSADDSYGAHSARRLDADGEGMPDEIVLHTERPVVTVEVVPTERVRLRIDTVEGQETVTEQVQRERIAVDETPSVGRLSPR
jgi:stress response protein YsnF